MGETMVNEERHPALYEVTSGIRQYALERGENTAVLLEGAIVQTSNRIANLAKNEIGTPTTAESLRKYAAKAVSEVTKEHMKSGMSIPRVFFGGKYRLEDVIGAASCIDAAVFSKAVLEQGFGINCIIHSTRLGVVPTHHYLEIEDTGEVIDAILSSKKSPGGYFKDKETFEERMDLINSGGLKTIIRQIRNIIRPKNPEPSSGDYQRKALSTPESEITTAMV